MTATSIEWTRGGFTWNPYHGCREIGFECGRHFPGGDGKGACCYAARDDSRNLHAAHVGTAISGKWTGLVTCATEATWNAPYTWNRRKPGAFVFACSMSDFFYEEVPLPWLDRALGVIEDTDQLIYLLLTKRPGLVLRKLAALGRRHLPVNVWLGATIGHRHSLPLLKPLLKIEAAKKFLSHEPVLTSLIPGLDLTGIDWGITGGQSGPGALLCDSDHVREIRDLYHSERKAFFHKQWGTLASNPTPPHLELDPKAKGGATFDGHLWRQFPVGAP